MIVTPVAHNLDLMKSELIRSSGVHASDIYGSLFKKLFPKRYDYGDGGNPVLMALGSAWEKQLEYLLIANGVNAYRPDEYISPEGIAFSPDLIIFNTHPRVGEIKLTSMALDEMPVEEATTLPLKMDKYLCVAPEVTLLTSDLRQIRADEIQVGHSVIGFDEHTSGKRGDKRNLRHTRVRAVKRIAKLCSRLFLADGTNVTVSNDHQWFGRFGPQSARQWVSTDTLIRGDKIWPGAPRKGNGLLSRICPLHWQSCLSVYEQGWLAGIADGEGCLHQRKQNGGFRLSISQNPGLVLSEIERLLIKDGFRFTTTTTSGCVSFNISATQDVLRFLATIRPLRLLQKFQALERLPSFAYESVQVLRREALGEQWVYAIETDAHTYVANGLASHNCQMKLYAFWLELQHGWLAITSIRRPYDPELRTFDIEWTERELGDNHRMVMNHAKHEGLI